MNKPNKLPTTETEEDMMIVTFDGVETRFDLNVPKEEQIKLWLAALGK